MSSPDRQAMRTVFHRLLRLSGIPELTAGTAESETSS